MLKEKGMMATKKCINSRSPRRSSYPEAKPVTASIADVLATYNKGGIEFISTTTKDNNIPEGVSSYVVDGNDVNVPRYTGEDLQGQGFTQEQIERYFDKRKDGSYVMKSDITFRKQIPYKYNEKPKYETVKINTIEELRQYCGADSRQKLKDEGFTDELIDKYFDLLENLIGKTTYVLDFMKYSNYNIVKVGDNTIITFTLRNNSGKIKITVNPDGSYTESKIQFGKIRRFFGER